MRHFKYLSAVSLALLTLTVHAGSAEDERNKAIARFNAMGGKTTPVMEESANKAILQFESTAGKTTTAQQEVTERDSKRFSDRNPPPSEEDQRKARERANTASQLMKSPLFSIAGH